LIVVSFDVEITAVATVFTIDVVGFQVLLGVVGVWDVSHTGVLPWIFCRVKEEDVVGDHVVVSVGFVGVVNGWWFELEVKHSLAIVDPVVVIH